MLVQFSFKNFGSFKEETTFDMRAIKAYKDHEYNLLDANTKDKYLKVAVIYGLNASGKSNFVTALSYFRHMVLDSFSSEKKDNMQKKANISLCYLPYAFDTESNNIEFEVVFINNNLQYTYGFSFNNTKIVNEWLYQKKIQPKSKNIKVFERDNNNFKLGAILKQGLKKYFDNIDEDVLALSFFSKLKLDTNIFKNTYDNIYNLESFSGWSDSTTEDLLSYFFGELYDDEKDEFLDFLKALDIDIIDFYVKKNQDEKKLEVLSYHLGKDGDKYHISIHRESGGTKKMIALYALIKMATVLGFTLVIDELDMRLHPLLLKYIVDMFQSQNSKGQLIFTTHNTFLLDKKYLRRDQVWFTEKNEYGYSKLFSLAEFRLRKDASYEKDYLSGAFGAIPILKNFNFKSIKN